MPQSTVNCSLHSHNAWLNENISDRRQGKTGQVNLNNNGIIYRNHQMIIESIYWNVHDSHMQLAQPWYLQPTKYWMLWCYVLNVSRPVQPLTTQKSAYSTDTTQVLPLQRFNFIFQFTIIKRINMLMVNCDCVFAFLHMIFSCISWR